MQENLTIPSIAIAEYLKSMNFDKHIYCVTCPEAQKLFESYGFKCKYGVSVKQNTIVLQIVTAWDPTVGFRS